MRFLSKFSHSSLSLVERMGQYQPGGPRVSVASRRSSSKWRSISRISWRSAKLSDIDPVLKTHGQSKGIFKLFHTFRKQATQKFLYYENPRCKAVCSSRLFARTCKNCMFFCVNPQKSTGKVNLWKDGTNKPQATIKCPGAVLVSHLPLACGKWHGQYVEYNLDISRFRITAVDPPLGPNHKGLSIRLLGRMLKSSFATGFTNRSSQWHVWKCSKHLKASQHVSTLLELHVEWLPLPFSKVIRQLCWLTQKISKKQTSTCHIVVLVSAEVKGSSARTIWKFDLAASSS